MAGMGEMLAAAGPIGAAVAVVDAAAKAIAGTMDTARQGIKLLGDTTVDAVHNDYLGAFNRGVDATAETLKKVPIAGQVWAAELPALRADGTPMFTQNPAWGSFKRAIEDQDLDGSRLRHCPICHRVYYAVRRNTLACAQHRNLANVWRKRGKLPEYNANRRRAHRHRKKTTLIREKMKREGPSGRARRELELQSHALRSEEK